MELLCLSTSPSSAILSEIYLQYMEYKQYRKILQKRNIIGYFRYVDDILLMFAYTLTDINSVLHEFNHVNSHSSR